MTLLLLFALAFTPARAQVEAAAPRGAKGPLDEERLAKLLAGTRVEGYVIDGEDLRAAIAGLGGGRDVQISHCIIDGGLRFEGTVHRRLAITDCDVRAAPAFTRGQWAGSALYARQTTFTGDVDFSKTRFDGAVVLVGARFGGKAAFAGTRFGAAADFTNARLTGDAQLWNAVFRAARFDGAVFEAAANFDRTTFLEPVSLAGTEFHGPALFRRAGFQGEGRIGAIFHQRADFSRAEFALGASFSGDSGARGATFRGETDFAGGVFGGPVDFSDVVFPGTASFEGCAFRADARFAGARFDASTAFQGVRFGGAAVFQRVDFADDTAFKGATFQGPADFTYARFQGPASFSRARFAARADFFDSTMPGGVSFAEAELGGPANFLRVGFGGQADFTTVHFKDRAYIAHATFAQDALFRNARFDGDAVFRGAGFHGLLDFQGLTATGAVDLAGTGYGAYADLRDAHLHRLDFNSADRPAIVAARFDMRGARLGEAHFEDVIFENDVDFSDATFGAGEGGREATTLFRFVTFEAGASFARARFSGRLGLENVEFRNGADFTDADLSGVGGGPAAFSLSYVGFGDLRIEWAQLPPPGAWVQQGEPRIGTTMEPGGARSPPQPLEPLSRVYERLEAGFRNHDRLADANAAYYYRKRTELHEAREQGLTWHRLWLEVQWIFWGATSGYGTRLWWIVGWTALVDLLFTLIYWRGAAIHRESHPETQREHSLRMRLLDLPKQYLKGKSGRMIRSKLVDAFRVSSVILLKVGYRDTTLSGSVAGIRVDYLVRVEWAIGFYILAVLTVTLANTQPLLNRLITGVF